MRSLQTKLMAATALVASALVATSANAAISIYDFVGQCNDCEGTGIGRLTLDDYTPGDELNTSNFVSFTYNSNLLSNLVLNGVFYLNGSLGAESGSYGVSFGGLGTVDGESEFINVSTSNAGTEGSPWTVLIGGVDLDNGPAHSWSLRAVGAIPEPQSWAMMVAGFGMLGLAMRRRQKVTVRFA